MEWSICSFLFICILALAVSGCGEDVDMEDCEELNSDINEALQLDGCYHITSSLTVRDEGAVTIAPGSTLFFDSDVGLEIRGGTLDATGTASAPITFRSAVDAPDAWRGLRFRETNSHDNRLVHTIIEGAGGDQRFYEHSSVALTNSSEVRVAIENSTIRDGEGIGLFTDRGAILEEFSNNTISGHAGAPAAVRKRVVPYLDQGTDYSGNGQDLVHILASHGNTLSEDGTWLALNVPYRVRGPVSVRDGAQLTIEAGSELRFDSETGIEIREGYLSLNGTAGDEIVLRGYEDLANFWRGIRFRGTHSTTNQLSHVTFEHAASENNWGSASADPAQLMVHAVDGQVSVGLSDVTFESGEIAIYIESDGVLSSCDNVNAGADNITGSGAADAIATCTQ